jgi:hypothetical protein
MRPQRKPFVVEIKKAKQFSRKPTAAGAGSTDTSAPTGAQKVVSTAFRTEGRAR